MKGHLNVNSTVGGPLELLKCYLNYLHLSCQNRIFFFFLNILVYEISVTTCPFGLKFSGIREGVNKLTVLKFQSNMSSLRENVKIWNSGKLVP